MCLVVVVGFGWVWGGSCFGGSCLGLVVRLFWGFGIKSYMYQHIIEYGNIPQKRNINNREKLMARTAQEQSSAEKTTSKKGKENARIWIYIPTKVSEDNRLPIQNSGQPLHRKNRRRKKPTSP
jgi:hypothetical protein